MGIAQNKHPKITLKEIIFGSKLDRAQKELWYSFIRQVIEDEASSILKVLQEDPTALDFLTENLCEKLKAMKSSDKEDWMDIIKKEREYIEKK